MNRRQVLQWLSGGIAAACSAVVVVPGVSYVLATVKKREYRKAVLRRVTPLSTLRPGRPVAMPITGSRSDAWTMYPQELIGRVWLVRKSDESTPMDQVEVQAFTTICPHLGCETQEAPGGTGIFCPCHKAKFGLDGAKTVDRKNGERNHAPRALDSLECHVVQDETSREWWVEVKYEEFERGLTKKIAKA